MPLRIEKRLLASMISLAPHRLFLALQQLIAGSPMLRAVNYHSTPESAAAQFRRQLSFFREHYDDVTMADLERLLGGGGWRGKRPGLILSFDDGFRNNATVAAPILEEHGYTGWFFIPSDLIADSVVPASGDAQRMTWEEVRTLSHRHVVGSHTRTHCRLRRSVSAAGLSDEILGSKAVIEERLAGPVEAFCWVGGEEDTYTSEAAELVRKAGYRWAFMTNMWPITASSHPHQLQRTNLEADWPMSVVRFQLSGFMDLLYCPKRLRVQRETA